MYHNEHSLLKIEKWARWLSWYFVFAVVMNLLSLGYQSVDTWLNPAVPTWVAYTETWYKLWVPASGVFNLFILVIFWFLLVGIAKTIRFLLALKARVMPEDAAASEI